MKRFFTEEEVDYMLNEGRYPRYPDHPDTEESHMHMGLDHRTFAYKARERGDWDTWWHHNAAYHAHVLAYQLLRRRDMENYHKSAKYANHLSHMALDNGIHSRSIRKKRNRVVFPPTREHIRTGMQYRDRARKSRDMADITSTHHHNTTSAMHFFAHHLMKKGDPNYKHVKEMAGYYRRIGDEHYNKYGRKKHLWPRYTMPP